LPTIGTSSTNGISDGFIEISIDKDHKGVITSEFHNRLLKVLPGFGGNERSSPGASSEADSTNGVMRQDGINLIMGSNGVDILSTVEASLGHEFLSELC
jgi:hypothetical protein